MGAAKKVIAALGEKIDQNEYQVVAAGTTGSARKLVGAMCNASIVKNEITAHAVGTTTLHPDVRTILEIGGQDSKIICVENGVAVDYAMNTLCAAGTGSFLSSQARRLGVEVEEFGKIALSSKNPTPIAARCTVFAESDLVHKIQMGHKKEDIILIIAYFPLFLQDLTFSCSFCPCWCILFLQFTHAFLEADLCSHKNLLPEMHEGSATPCAKMSCEAAESSVFANGTVNCNMLCVDELMPTAAKG